MTTGEAGRTDRATGSEERFDLVVVGAGPAGSATALSALRTSPGLRVLLVDKDDFPRDKCCGDGLAPHVFDVLRELGVDDAAAGWEPLEVLEMARRDRRVQGRMQRPVWVIPRQVFDARLVAAAQDAGAELRRTRVADLAVGEDRVVLTGRDGHRLTAPVVVGADGAHSVVRKALGHPAADRRALAIRGYVPTPAGHRGRQVIRYGDRRQPAYAWCFDRGDGLANVGYGELVAAGGDRDDALRGDLSRALMLEQVEELLPGATAGASDWRAHHLPLSGRRWHHPDGRVLLVGDAAGLVNPMTGEGIYYAVRTGAIAGRTAAHAIAVGTPTAAGAAHREDVQRALARHLRHTWAASRLSRSTAVVDAGIRAAAHSPGLFDDLVEIGLGDGPITGRLARGLVAGLATTLPREWATAARATVQRTA